jgi:hypothetical protein
MTPCAHCTHRRVHHRDIAGPCLVARCDCPAYVDPEAPPRPVFTLPEARALWELTQEAGRGAPVGRALPTLSVPTIRVILARCQQEGGDPVRVYAYFVASDDAVRRGRVSAPPVELVRRVAERDEPDAVRPELTTPPPSRPACIPSERQEEEP